jgi:hypothetical protein
LITAGVAEEESELAALTGVLNRGMAMRARNTDAAATAIRSAGARRHLCFRFFRQISRETRHPGWVGDASVSQ